MINRELRNLFFHQFIFLHQLYIAGIDSRFRIAIMFNSDYSLLIQVFRIKYTHIQVYFAFIFVCVQINV